MATVCYLASVAFAELHISLITVKTVHLYLHCLYLEKTMQNVKTLYKVITHLYSLLRGEISTQAVNPYHYLGIQVRTPCKPCCIVRYLIYILLYVLARFAIWINEWIKRINDIIYNKILTILIFKLLNINWHFIVTGSKLISQKQLFLSYLLERFSFECRKVIGFAFATLHDWLRKRAPLFHSIRSKTKTNGDLLAHVFPCFASATCSYFEFWLDHCIVCVLCDWLE